MADVIARSHAHRPGAAAPRYDLIELLFFAYRDFVQEADAVEIRG
jgi:hypothetical protein